MDSVRFGRALGFGARSAAKALITAVDAAAAPNPNAPPTSAASPRPTEQPQPQPQRAQSSTTPGSAQQPRKPQPAPAPRPIVENAVRAAAEAQAHARQATKGVAAGSKQLGRSVWRPFVKLSGVLWLEITGSFFALIAFFTGESLWVHRADVHANPLNPTAHEHFLVYLIVTVMFSWFAVSSFLRARRRSRSS